MAKSKNKPLSKEALKQPDEFLALNAKFMTWVIQHKILVIAIVVVILLIGGGFSGFKYYGYKQELKAAELTAQAKQVYLTELQAGNAMPFKTADAIFSEIFSSYGKTQNAAYAHLIRANIAYQAKEHELALQSYQAALPDYAGDPLVAGNIQNSIGYCYMALEDNDRALEAFQKVVGNASAALQDDALYNMGVIYAKQDATAKSAEAFAQILAAYPNSIHAELLKNRPAE